MSRFPASAGKLFPSTGSFNRGFLQHSPCCILISDLCHMPTFPRVPPRFWQILTRQTSCAGKASCLTWSPLSVWTVGTHRRAPFVMTPFASTETLEFTASVTLGLSVATRCIACALRSIVVVPILFLVQRARCFSILINSSNFLGFASTHWSIVPFQHTRICPTL